MSAVEIVHRMKSRHPSVPHLTTNVQAGIAPVTVDVSHIPRAVQRSFRWMKRSSAKAFRPSAWPGPVRALRLAAPEAAVDAALLLQRLLHGAQACGTGIVEGGAGQCGGLPGDRDRLRHRRAGGKRALESRIGP